MNIIGNISTELEFSSKKVIRKRLRLKKRFTAAKSTGAAIDSTSKHSTGKRIHHSTDDSENEGIF